jgi:hypothetical protein
MKLSVGRQTLKRLFVSPSTASPPTAMAPPLTPGTPANSNTTASVWEAAGRILEFSEKDITPVTLEYLLDLSPKNPRGCALYVYNELPIRLARRVQGNAQSCPTTDSSHTVPYKAIQTLPFIVGVNPFIRSIYNLYLHSFKTLVDLPPPTSQETQAILAKTLSELVESHQNVIPELAQGFAECGKYMSKEASHSFLDGMIHARIGIRVMAEHFLALQSPVNSWVGIVHTQLSPARVCQSVADYVGHVCELNYGVMPDFQLNGHLDTTMAYVPVHLEYILTEILKNSYRATVETCQRNGRLDIPDLEISIAQGEQDVTIRVRDEGGGISPSSKTCHAFCLGIYRLTKGNRFEQSLGLLVCDLFFQSFFL